MPSRIRRVISTGRLANGRPGDDVIDGPDVARRPAAARGARPTRSTHSTAGQRWRMRSTNAGSMSIARNRAAGASRSTIAPVNAPGARPELDDGRGGVRRQIPRPSARASARELGADRADRARIAQEAAEHQHVLAQAGAVRRRQPCHGSWQRVGTPRRAAAAPSSSARPSAASVQRRDLQPVDAARAARARSRP